MDYESARGPESEAESLNLIPEIAAAAAAAVRNGATPLLPNADNVVVLPQGASLDDIEVKGRDLVVELADGRVFVIPDGAIFVPIIVIDGVAVPPLNFAAYLMGDQPQPAAGPTQSSGGNFAEAAGPIQAAFGIGDLLPYTELSFPLAQNEEVLPGLVNNTPTITFVPVIGDGTEVTEAGLPPTTTVRTNESQGSKFDGNAETTASTVTFTSLDGVSNISINGVTLNAGGFPQTVLSNNVGTLVVTGVTFDPTTGNGSISYVFTLNDNTVATNGSEVSVPISVTDQDGDVAVDTLVIRIIDDAPTAFPNTNLVQEGGTVGGNVLTDQTKDVFGADGPTTTVPAGGVVGVRAANGNTTTAVTGGTGSQIQGQYGTLTLNANGGYSYTAKANVTTQDVQDVFVYTIQDGDGDTSTTTLTITIDDVTGTVNDNNVLVDESGLDGIGSQLVPNGEFFTTGQITASGAAGTLTYALTSPADGTYGTLTLNGSTGAYSYVLDTPFDGPTANNGRNTIAGAESFGYKVTDQAGNVIGTGSIVVDIVDDVPTAFPNTNTVDEGGTVGGNVLTDQTKDIFGADGAATTTPAGGVIGVRAANGDTTTAVAAGTGSQIQGLYGTLTLNADGGYTYVAKSNFTSQDVQDVFVYTIEDGDGDRSTTTLTINVNDVSGLLNDNDVIVDESGLNIIGSQLVPNGEFFTNGQISVNGANGPFIYTLTSPADGTYGTLTLNTATGAYSYVLDTPFDGPTSNNGRNTISGAESFGYKVTDQSGNAIGTGTIVVNIVDDVPTAFPNTNTVQEGGTVGGNVLTDQTKDIFGADGPTTTVPAGGVIGVRAANGNTTTPVTSGTGIQIQGLYGTLTLNANGTYTYVSKSNAVTQDVQDVFVYTIEDGDGDRSTTTLTITIDDVQNDFEPVAGTVNATLDDDALAGGNAGGVDDDNPDTSGTSGNLIGSGGNPGLTFALANTGAPAGFTYDSAGANTLQIKQGATTVATVTITNPTTGAYTITQNNPIDHVAGNDENNQTFTISYTVTDADGDKATGTLNINVDDDTPTVTAALSTGSKAALDETAVTSTADTFGVATIGNDPEVPGAGRIAFATSGSSVVTVGGGYGADGAGTLTYALSVTNAASGLQVTDGSAINLVSESGVIVGRVSGGTFNGQAAFAVRITASGVVEVEQYLSLKHPANPDPDDTIAMTAGHLGVTVTRTDGDGDTVTSAVVDISGQITFDDDGPVANNDADNIVGGSLGPATGNVITGIDIGGGDSNATDGTADTLGADGGRLTFIDNSKNAAPGQNVPDGGFTDIAGEYGTLRIFSNGNYSYTRGNAAPGDVSEVFTYTLQDGDGDTITATLTISIGDAQPVAGTVNATLDDDALAGGNLGGTGDDNPDTSGTSGNLIGSGGDPALTFKLLDTGVVETGGGTGFTYVYSGDDLLIKQNGTTVVTVDITASTGAYTITQNAPIKHSAGSNENNQTFAISYTVTDADGDKATGTLNINVDDDSPTVTASLNSNAKAALDETAAASAADTFGVATIGNDPDVSGTGRIAFGTSGTSVVTVGGGYGADGPGTVGYALSITNAASGLQVTDGSAINLVDEGGVIVGRVSGGTFNGQAAFAVRITASGVVEVEQYLSLKHPNTTDPDDTIAMTADHLGVVVTRSDGDGDTVTATVVDISNQITFDDDGPVANNDADSISGGLGPATGNVITGIDIGGGDSNVTDGTPDTLGADGAKVVGVAAGDTNTALNSAPTVGSAVQGTYGKLTLNSDGSYSYTRDNGNAGNFVDKFTYTLQDGDGDTDTATLTISIGDAQPTAGTVNATLDDDALAGGNAGGTGDDTPDTSGTSGNLVGSGGDPGLTFALLDTGVVETGGGTGFTYELSGDDLLIKQNGTTVITVDLTPSTGAYTITQNNPIKHDAGSNENNQTFAISYTVTDADGDKATGTLNINVDDDTPTVTASLSTGSKATLDETAAASAADTFGVATIGDDPDVSGTGRIAFATSGTAVVTVGGGYGADGAGTVTYALSVTNAASGLQVTDGSSITLVNEGGVIVGRVSGGTFNGQAAFAARITSSGVVEVEQYLSLKHPNTADPDDTISMTAGHLGATATRTDGDGDSVTSAVVDISSQITFDDDGPSVTASLNANAKTALDETATTSVAAAFGVSNIGNDPDVAGTGAIASGTSGTSVVTVGGGYGADGPGTVSYALSVTGAASGLQVTDGSAINLVSEGGVVVGRVSGGTLNGQAAFAVRITASGVVEVEQYLSLKHPNTTDPDDTIAMTADHLGVVVTRSDGDGDTATATVVDISSQITFDDDGPVANNDADSISGGLGPATGNVITGIDIGGGDSNVTDGTADTLGADGAKVVGVAAGDTNTPLNSAPTVGAAVQGTYGKLTLNSDGSYSYTRDNGNAGNFVDKFTYTLQDGDGDTDTATLTISIGDAQPVAGTVNATLDDDALAGGNAGGTGDDAISGTSGNLAGSGGDPGLTFALLNTGVVETGGGTGFTYELSGGDLLIKQSGTTVVTVDLTNSATGAYTITQNNPIKHSAGSNENNQTFAISYTVTDADGDKATGTLNIDVDDDTPTVTASLNSNNKAALDETAAASTADTFGVSNIGNDPDVSGAGRIAFGTSTNSVVTVGGGYGADGAGTVSYALSITNAASGLQVTDGSAINLVSEGGVIVGRVSGGTFNNQAAFAVRITSGGVVEVEQYLSLKHPSNPNPDDTISMTADHLGVTVTRTDGDGDSVTSAVVDLSGQITFDDDGPTLGTIQSQQANSDPSQAKAVGTLHFAPGADGASTTMTITANVAGITSGGKSLYTSQTGNVLTAFADLTGNGASGDDTPVFTLTVNPTAGTSGQYEFDLLQALDGTIVPVKIGSGSSFGSGPSNSIVVNDGSQDIVFVTGWAPAGGFNEATWYAGGNPALTQTSNLNGSTSGWGLGNNNFDSSEFIRFDFGALNDYDGVGGYSPPAAGPMATAAYATFTFENYAAGDTVKLVAHYSDGTTQSFTNTGGVDPASRTITAPAGKTLAWVDVYESTGSIKLNLAEVGVQTTVVDKTIQFTLQLNDGDLDPTSTGAFSVQVKDGLTPFSPAPPVVLDLDGNGVEFVALGAGAAFDYDGDGRLEHTAWVGAHDGLLAIDLNGDGVVNDGSELVFGGDGVTDLEGLAAQYDTNGDGVLDASDAGFAKFGVWQDADTDGVTDAGEFKSLVDLGIVSIGLKPGGAAYDAANGEVSVLGESTYVRSDGTTGIVADANFMTDRTQVRSNEIAAAAAAAGVLANAQVLDQAAAASAGPEASASSPVAEEPAQTGTSLFLSANDDPAPSATQAGDDSLTLAEPKAPESHSVGDEDDASPADALGQVSDHQSADSDFGQGGDQSADADVGGPDHLIAASASGGADLMQGLLLLAQAPAPADAGDVQDLGAVQEALADAHAENFVDSLVGKLGASEAPAAAEAPQHDLAALLATDIGNDHAPMPSAFDFNQLVDEVHASAAA